MSYDARIHGLADLVQETDRFLAREEAGEGEGEYHLRDGGLAVILRHGTADLSTFDEVFGQRLDDPPPEVRQAVLRGSGPPRILDLGAHTGLTAAFWLTIWPGAHVTAVEPDRANLALLERCAQLNAGAGEWQVIGAAASDADGTITLEESGDASSTGAGDGDGVERPARDVLSLVAEADLLKLDLESGEWPILTDPRFAGSGVAAVVVEYHPAGAPSDDPRGDAERLLQGAGLTTRFLFEKDDGVGMLWAWR